MDSDINVTNARNSLNDILGPVTVNGPGTDSFSVNDLGNSVGHTYTLTAMSSISPTANRLTRDGAAPITWTGLNTLQMTGATGADTFNIESLANNYITRIYGGGGLDVFNVSPQAQDMDNLSGILDLEGEFPGQSTANASLAVNDQNHVAARNWLFETNALVVYPSVGSAAQATAIYFYLFNTVVANGGSGGNTYRVVGTGATTSLTINAGSGNDAINVGSAGNLLDPIQGPLTINGQAGNSTLTVNDQNATADETYIVTANAVSRTRTATIGYTNCANVAVYAGIGINNTFFIEATAAGTRTDVYGGTGTNEFVVTSALVTLDSIQGPLSLHGRSGPASESYMLLNDALNPLHQTWTLTAGTVNRSGTAPITYDHLIQDDLYTSELTSAAVNVQSNAAGFGTGIAIGPGDQVTLGSLAPLLGGTLANIQGSITLTSYRLGNMLPAIVVDDSGDATAHPLVLLSSDPPYDYGLTGLAPAQILFLLDPTTPVSIKGGKGNDTFTVASPLQDTGIEIDGGGGTNALVGPNTANTWAITGKNSGTLNTIAFSKFQNLVGGSVSDAFEFSAGNGVTGTINGGSGTTTLDYSHYTTRVNVNLITGTATGTGGVSNILDVTGSPKNDVITGDNANNIISGNGGKDILIGGGTGNHTFILPATNTNGATVIGGTGSDTLVGANVSNTWTLTGPNTGTVHGTQFAAIANLLGGTDQDTFRFMAGGNVSGIVDGGGGSADTLDYSGNGGAAIAVNLQTGSATSTGGISNIEKLVGSTATSNTLTGADVSNVWSITAANAGTVDAFDYKGIEYLVGGKGLDVFKFNTAGTEVGINGGGAPANQGDWLDYSSLSTAVTVNLATGRGQQCQWWRGRFGQQHPERPWQQRGQHVDW